MLRCVALGLALAAGAAASAAADPVAQFYSGKTIRVSRRGW